MKKVHFINTLVADKHGGRTKTLLERAKLLGKNNVEVNIYNRNYNPNYFSIERQFRKKGIINNNVKFHNIYDYYKIDKKGSNNDFIDFLIQELTKINLKLKNENLSLSKRIKQKLKNRNKYEVLIKELLQGKTQHIEYYDSEDRLIFKIFRNLKLVPTRFQIYDLNSQNLVVHGFINHRKNVHKIVIYNRENGLKEKKQLFDNGFNIYYEVKFNQDEENKASEVMLHKSNSESVSFEPNKDFYTYYYNEILKDGDVVVIDARRVDGNIFACKHDIKIIYQLHSSQIYTNLFEHEHEQKDRIVVLTKQQKENILKFYPQLEKNLVVIPHSIEKKNIKNRVINNQICMVARLAAEKNIPDAIEAFSIFDKKVSGYKLVIYGKGKQKEILEKIIKEKNLEDKVILKGFTRNVDKVFQSSKFSIITSKYEGFGLSVLESIANGCPVISYDINYGPKEIIKKVSGVILKENTPQALAKAMVEETKKNRDRNEITKTIAQFSKDKFVSSWLDLISGKI